MKTSDSIVNISKALAEAQKKISHASKDSKNPHFRSDYASLESVIDATKSALLDHGLFIIQSVDEKKLVTRIQHSSGEFFESSLEMLLQKNDMQGLGSAITYARRYSLASMLNIAQADDDANEASKQTKKAPDVAARVLNDKVDFNSYIIQFGKKMAGKKLGDFTVDDHIGMMSWLDGESKKKNRPIDGAAKEYYDIANAYVESKLGAPPPKVNTGELFPD